MIWVDLSHYNERFQSSYCTNLCYKKRVSEFILEGFIFFEAKTLISFEKCITDNKIRKVNCIHCLDNCKPHDTKDVYLQTS